MPPYRANCFRRRGETKAAGQPCRPWSQAPSHRGRHSSSRVLQCCLTCRLEDGCLLHLLHRLGEITSQGPEEGQGSGSSTTDASSTQSYGPCTPQSLKLHLRPQYVRASTEEVKFLPFLPVCAKLGSFDVCFTLWIVYLRLAYLSCIICRLLEENEVNIMNAPLGTFDSAMEAEVKAKVEEENGNNDDALLGETL